MIIVDCLNERCAVYVAEGVAEAFGAELDISRTGHVLRILDTPTETVNVAIKWFAFGLRLAHSQLFSEKGLTRSGE